MVRNFQTARILSSNICGIDRDKRGGGLKPLPQNQRRKTMNKEEQGKAIMKKVELIKKKHGRCGEAIRQMKEGKLETLGTIVASSDGNIFIEIAGDKLIFMTPAFLGRFKDALAYLDEPESNLIIARLMEFEAKQIRQDAEDDIRQFRIDLEEQERLKSRQRKE